MAGCGRELVEPPDDFTGVELFCGCRGQRGCRVIAWERRNGNRALTGAPVDIQELVRAPNYFVGAAEGLTNAENPRLSRYVLAPVLRVHAVHI